MSLCGATVTVPSGTVVLADTDVGIDLYVEGTLNANGAVFTSVRDPDHGVESVELVSLAGAENKKTVTDNWGRYLFADLPAGQYRVLLTGKKQSVDIQITDHSLGEVNFD